MALNNLMRLKITRRTWAQKAEKIKTHRRTRKARKSRKKNADRLPIILNLNSRSICKKKEELTQLLADNNADIVVITETWLTADNEQVQLNALKNDNPNYEIFSEKRNRDDVARGGGLITMINKDYAKKYDIIETSSYEKNDTILEALTLRVMPFRKPRGYSSCIITAVYIPPGRKKNTNNKKDEATGLESKEKQMKKAVDLLNTVVTEAIEKSSKCSKPLIFVMGDFNGVDTSQLNRSLGTYVINKKPTRQGTKTAKLLDPIITNAPKCYRSINKKPLGKSDHDIVKAYPLEIKYKSTIQPKKKVQIRTGRLEDTIEEIGNIDWTRLIALNENEDQRKFDIFYETVEEINNVCQPLKTVKINADQKWMTTEIKKEIEIRQRFHFEKKEIEWKFQVKKVKKMIKKRKRAYTRDSRIKMSTGGKRYNKYGQQQRKRKSTTARSIVLTSISMTSGMVKNNRT